MSLILLPGDVDRGKTFYATHCRADIKNGVVRGHIPPEFIAANCLTQAKAQGCEDIVIELEGMRPQRFTVRYIEEVIQKDPLKFLGWIPRPLYTKEEKIRNAVMRIFMQNKPGGILHE